MINSIENKENEHTMFFKSKHLGRLLPTASTFGPIPNYGGEAYSLPYLHPIKKGGFASGKITFDPLYRKKILGMINRASTIKSEDQAKYFIVKSQSKL